MYVSLLPPFLQFIISKKPEGSPVTDRAIPVAIFQADQRLKEGFLKRWLKTGNRPQSFEIRFGVFSPWFSSPNSILPCCLISK